jgi:hypothetical protein
MTLSTIIKYGCRATGALVAILLLSGSPQLLLAQSAPTGEPPRQTEQADDKATRPEDTTVDGNKTLDDRGSAYRKQKDNLRPFEPSEEIRVDKAVDFPADI